MGKRTATPRAARKRARTSPIEGAQPTIHDVAAAARVSIATVSNVVNARLSRVSERTRRRVLHYIGQLGYRPQLIGRSLRTARRNLLAIVIIDESENYLLDPFASNLVAGFTGAVNAAGYATVVHGGRLRDFEDIVVIRTLGVDGYCFHLSGDEPARKALLSRLVDLNQPVILAQETLPPVSGDTCVVRQDDFGGGQQLADHLLARGARKMVFVTPVLEWPALTARIAGLRKGVQRAGQEASIQVVRSQSEEFRSVYQAVDAFLAAGARPDAVLGANDQMAIASMHALLRHGLEVPRDVLVTGFNAFEFWQYVTPTLTTVRSPAREIGRVGAQALVQRLKQGTFQQREHVLPVALQIGGSTESSAASSTVQGRPASRKAPRRVASAR